MKENAVDCLLNRHANFHKPTDIKQILSSNFFDIGGSKSITINTGNIDNSEECDYLECNYKCNSGNKDIKIRIKENGPITNTYNLTHIKNNKTGKICINNGVDVLSVGSYLLSQENKNYEKIISSLR